MNCTFCGLAMLQGTGFTLYKKDGTPVHYCSKKCEKNAFLKRNPRRLKWTNRFLAGKSQKSKPSPSGVKA